MEERDFLLSPVPVGTYDVIAANPPYWRFVNLPPGYRAEYELMVPAHARADLLLAYLDLSARIVAPGGRIGLITADRWLINSGSPSCAAAWACCSGSPMPAASTRRRRSTGPRTAVPAPRRGSTRSASSSLRTARAAP